MSDKTRIFEAKRAVRGETEAPLLIGLEGPPGAGKSYSALELATGMKEIRGGPIIVIDTEGTRSLMYADQFEFERVGFDPPFRSPDFLEAVKQQLPRNPAAIILDNFSDEHEGDGGYLDWHEDEIDRMLGDNKNDWRRRDALKQAGWIVPKRGRVKMMGVFNRLTVPLIFCYRSRQKTKPMPQMKNGREVTVPVNLGWQPICPPEISGMMTIMCLLPQNAGGVPQWKSDNATQDFVIKLPQQFRELFAQEGPITRAHGRALAEWARGGAMRQAEPATASPASPLAIPLDITEDGTRRYVPWADRFEAEIRAATSLASIEAIEDANDTVLDELRANPRGGKLYGRIMQAVHEAKSRFDADAPDDLAEGGDGAPGGDQFAMAAE